MRKKGSYRRRNRIGKRSMRERKKYFYERGLLIKDNHLQKIMMSRMTMAKKVAKREKGNREFKHSKKIKKKRIIMRMMTLSMI